MVFFNHSTMQMAAKIVYYGPGLCGKTTNLQHIYNHTSRDSRGEMVSLETDTDRTLFFDLLPIEVGTIQGFSTRIQLYTVPGQVFYNTTRKLVLKGVDGVVFVADSQRAMLQANRESFSNLEENLREIGLTVDELPLVLQYNKRDLKDICAVDEIDRALNRGGWPAYEAAALHGQGVFETLRAISKLTLLSLKRRLGQSSIPAARPRPAPAAPAPRPAPAAAPRSAPESPAPVAVRAAPAPAAGRPPAAAEPPRARRELDILAELEKIREQGPRAPKAEAPPRGAGPALNGSRSIDDRLRFEMARADLRRARRLSLQLRVEDGAEQLLELFEGGWDVEDPETLERLRLHLDIALGPRD
jgi:signal recognition particle receptor subunit beta